MTRSQAVAGIADRIASQ